MNKQLALELVRIGLRYGAPIPALLGAPLWLVTLAGGVSQDPQVIGILAGALMAGAAETGWLKSKRRKARD